MAQARQVMIVGNGPVDDGVASLIDAADLVIRFNGSRNFGVAGRRTDIVAVCNTGRPGAAMLADPEWRDSEAVRRTAEIWSVRDPEKFGDLKPALAISHPELDDFCDDYTDGFASFAAAKGKRHRIIHRDVHEALDETLLALDAEPYVVPSSGLVVIEALLSDPAHAEDTIILAGFGHTGWDGHPFEAERRLVDRYIASGRLMRLQPLFASSLCQGT
ncbi:Urease operon accessory protein [Rhizobium glycinendophyticum]|uniref:Urease operon accessory protein n=1 Tax=Rhizobium glycinendophyticum TaxID=2589807 RepID=A0A504UYH4_9HYPH|nr:Urease operon accessory protein [Rhizobium glycinendophyticum]TPP11821.1 Urease operon accessory protein [Rhizobium glycinendophyticum]